MATAVMPKSAARPAAPARVAKAAPRALVDNKRDEDMASFAPVVFMPVLLLALVFAIAFWLTPALH